jgi:hypothetical protein
MGVAVAHNHPYLEEVVVGHLAVVEEHLHLEVVEEHPQPYRIVARRS